MPFWALLLSIPLVIYMLVMTDVLMSYDLDLGSAAFGGRSINTLIHGNRWYFVGFLIVGGISEEFFYRVPLIFFRKYPWYLLIVFLLSSFFFALTHGTIWRVFLQGVGGVVFGLFFLKCGGMNGRVMKAWISSSALHLIFNFMIIGITVFALAVRGEL